MVSKVSNDLARFSAGVGIGPFIVYCAGLFIVYHAVWFIVYYVRLFIVYCVESRKDVSYPFNQLLSPFGPKPYY